MAKKSSNKWIVGGFIIVAAIMGMSLLQLSDSTVYFYTPQEAIAQVQKLKEKTIQVGGMVLEESVQWEPEKLHLQFVVTDYKESEINVSYHGTAPDMFKPGQGVVVEGKLNAAGNKMVASKLLVKHSEEYQAPEEHHSANKELLKKSIFKN